MDHEMKIIRFTTIRTILLMLLMAIAISTLQGCSSPKSRLLGKWKEVGKTEVMEFFSDGRVSIADKGMTGAGSWVVLDDGRVKIEVNLLGMTVVGTGTLQGDTLRIDISGKISEYKKIPS